ncbi:site-specific integrase [Streptomyces sp. NBC_00885]|uniref:tyrosine-type recombinase/integrase n=1 Tax=Streptomyces sp. NBC_00885 TaxID=2975857 RepID=UPI003870E8BC|nr:site-specific integrase [Streptomyces sp. NBC_00885]
MADPIKKVTLQSGKVRYRFVIDAGRDSDGRRKQVTVTMDTLKEARDELARMRHERRTGQLILPSKMTVSQLLDAYMASKKDDIEESTLVGYRNALVHVHQQLGHMRLQELTEDHVEEFVTWLLVGARRRGGEKGTGIRPSTADGVLGRLRAALRLAVRRRLVARNVAEYVTVPRMARKADKRENQREKPWNETEVKTFVVGIRDDRMFAPLLLGLMGLRPAEVAGLRWSDIDFAASTLSVANTRTMIGNARVLEKDTKSEAGERTLPLPEPVRLALLQSQVLHEAEKAAMGSYYLESGYVFVDLLGQAMSTRQLREHAYSLMAKVGLRKVRLYDARHSCLTFLANSGIPDHILAAWAGHTNASFTKRVYVHPTAADMGEAVVHLNALLGVGDGAPEAPM